MAYDPYAGRLTALGQGTGRVSCRNGPDLTRRFRQQSLNVRPAQRSRLAPARRGTFILSGGIATADRHCANAHIAAIVRYTAAAEMYALSCRAVTPFRNPNDFSVCNKAASRFPAQKEL